MINFIDLSKLLRRKETQLTIYNILLKLHRMNANSSYHRCEWEDLMTEVKKIDQQREVK